MFWRTVHRRKEYTMDYVNTFSGKSKVNPLEKPIPKPKTEVSRILMPDKPILKNLHSSLKTEYQLEHLCPLVLRDGSILSKSCLNCPWTSEQVSTHHKEGHVLRCCSLIYLIDRLSEMGSHVGQRIVDIDFVRDRNYKRETRLINVLVFIKTVVWRSLFGKEADKLEQATDSETICE